MELSTLQKVCVYPPVDVLTDPPFRPALCNAAVPGTICGRRFQVRACVVMDEYLRANDDEGKHPAALERAFVYAGPALAERVAERVRGRRKAPEIADAMDAGSPTTCCY